MSSFDFYDAGPIRKVATNLFYGWGYNFYRLENQLRADDQLIRSKAAWLLGLAVSYVENAESDYRREFLPPPSRQHPFPDANAVAAAQKLERLSKSISALELSLHQQPVPENDRMTQRFRKEAPTLQELIAQDELLVGRCEMLRSMLENQPGTAILENLSSIESGVESIRNNLQQRAAILLQPA
jgi:hypothetical protein